jgi:predicted nucleic-acid-binding protein
MVAVDTNVIVRVIIRDNLNQTESVERFIQNGAWISILALAEAVWVLKSFYGLTPQELDQAIEMLLRHQHFVVEDPETVADALELFRAKPALGFADCLMLELARKAGHLPLGTFDRALAKVHGAIRL